MKKWQKSFLLAITMAGTLSMPAAAAPQTSAEQPEMVTVEVKNVKGGMLRVYYGEKWGTETWLDLECLTFLPIGEKVEIPKGTELHVNLIPTSEGGAYDLESDFGAGTNLVWESEAFDQFVRSRIEELNVVYADGSKEGLYSWEDENIDNELEGHIDNPIRSFTVNRDCTLEAEFSAHVDISNVELYEGEREYQDKRYDILPHTQTFAGETILDVELKAKFGEKEIKFSEVPGREIISVRRDGGQDFTEKFQLTDTGVKSTEKLPLGHYSIKIKGQKYPDNSQDKFYRTIHIYIGNRSSISIALAENPAVDEELEDYLTIWSSLYYIGSIENGQYMDGTKTTVGSLVESAEENKEWIKEDVLPGERFPEPIAGYKCTGIYTDSRNNTITKNTKTLLKDVADSRYGIFKFKEVLKNGSKIYEPAKLQVIPDNEVITNYQNAWIKTNEKWSYYDENGEKACNQWVDDWYYGPVFCDAQGNLVTNGIAGISLEDENGLWLVDEKGMTTDFTGTKEFGMTVYTIVDGEVVDIQTKKVPTPSNAAAVEELADSLNASMSQLTDEQKTEFGDKLAAGITGLGSAEKEKLSNDVIAKADRVLKGLYNVEPQMDVAVDGEIDDAMVLSDNFKAQGLIAASGYTSKDEGSEICLKVNQKQVATSSNAEKQVLRFDLGLELNKKKVSLKSPVILTVPLPEAFGKNYPKSAYTYRLEHILDNGKKENIIPEFSVDMKEMKFRIDSFSEFALYAKKKSTSGGSGSSGGSGGGSVKTYRAPNPVTVGTDGQWIQDAKGWWFRFEDGTWPRSQWIELEWNGVKNWYYFNEEGYMATGWKDDAGHTYYLHPASDGTCGYMYTGWHEINSLWYYFSTVSGGPKGSLLKSTVTPDGYAVDTDGVWIK